MATAPVPHLLLIEDEASFRDGVVTALELAGWRVSAHARAEPALQALPSLSPDVVLTDLRLPGADGLEVLRRCQAADAELPVLLMTGHGDVATAVQAIKGGAYDFVEKPFGRERLLILLDRALQHAGLTRRHRNLQGQLAATRGLADVLRGHGAAMQALRAWVLELAPLPTDVLLVGETGTGKELVARALHDFGVRSGPFVAINCAALPETLIEAELFGHSAGAFSGAQRARTGHIEHAHRGTLFLDELQAMPAPLQAKLLRVLQEREVQRLGTNETLALDLRVVAASNQGLRELVARGQFRADLFYRLEAVTLALPPLRERREDVTGLFEHFVDAAAQRFQRPPPALPPSLMARLLAHDWPGNVRELRGAAQRHALGLPALPEPDRAAAGTTLQATLAAIEGALIEDAIRQHRGQPEALCQALGLAPATLYRKLKTLGLRLEDYRAP